MTDKERKIYLEVEEVKKSDIEKSAEVIRIIMPNGDEIHCKSLLFCATNITNDFKGDKSAPERIISGLVGFWDSFQMEKAYLKIFELAATVLKSNFKLKEE